jgi:hypothetical protein
MKAIAITLDDGNRWITDADVIDKTRVSHRHVLSREDEEEIINSYVKFSGKNITRESIKLVSWAPYKTRCQRFCMGPQFWRNLTYQDLYPHIHIIIINK